MAGFADVPFLPTYDLQAPRGILALLLAMVLVGLCVHLAARSLLKKDDMHRAFTASVLGVLLALLAVSLLPSSFWIVGLALAVVAFVGAIGVTYGAKPQGALAVGAVSWVLWILANFALRYVQDHWQP